MEISIDMDHISELCETSVTIIIIFDLSVSLIKYTYEAVIWPER